MRTMLIYEVLLLVLIPASVADPACPVPNGVRCNCESGPPGKGRVINCRDGGFKSIPTFNPSSEVFSELTFSNSFDPVSGTCISCNRIKSIPANAFPGIRFEALDISRNHLSEVSSAAFNGLENILSVIIMDGDKVMAPPYAAFSRLQNLKRLSLRKFAQGIINKATFPVDSLVNLETLEFKHMDIEVIEADAFRSRLPSLKKLLLEYLPLKYFPKDGLAPLTNLEELSAIYVDLQTIPKGAFEKLTSLKTLILSHNKIRTLEYGCFDGIEKTLEHLGLQLNTLGNVRIQELGRYQWAKLEHLNIGHNILTHIPRGLFYNMRQLGYLLLDSNRLSKINRDDFQGLENLIFLDISYNQLESIERGAFMSTPHLREIDLRGENTLTRSKIFTLDAHSLQGVSDSLEKLVLTDSVLNEDAMWSAVKRMRNVVVLELGGTGIHYIPDFQFIHSGKLKYLMLENNNLTSITQTMLAGLQDVVVNINLQRNRVRVIDNCAFKQLSKLRTLYLGGNPLKCDCDAVWLYSWIQEQKAEDPFMEILTNANCDTGRSLTSHTLQDLCPIGFSDESCISYSNITYPPSTAYTTTPPITVLPPVARTNFHFRQIVEEADSVSIHWKFENSNEIESLVLEHQDMERQDLKVHDIPRAALSYKASKLKPNSRHLFCLKIHFRNAAKKDIRPCVLVNTLF